MTIWSASAVQAANCAGVALARQAVPPSPADTVRVALFPDSYHEANGVARTFRTLTDVARRRQLPLLIVRCGSAGAGQPPVAGPQCDGSI
ncbi:MAG: hypothetical protein SNJ67_09810, partial [Chloracidobacterium sp.]